MSYEDLIRRIEREIPGLAGKLSAPRVVYVRSLKKTYITFESSVLVGEKEFLRLEAILRETFPGRPLAVRVVSPSLRESFLRDVGAYRSVLTDFLRRNYPGIVAWLPNIDWSCQGERVTLIFPDEFSLEYVGKHNIANRLATAIKDIFDARVIVETTVAGDREARLEKMRREREESLRVITRAEMAERYGTGYDEKQETAAKPKQKRTAEAGKPKAEKNPAPAAPKEPESALETGIPIPEMSDQTVNKPILGRSIADRPVEIRELTAESGLVVIQGDVFMLETKELKGGETLLVSFAVTDYTSSILCKVFLRYRARRGRRGEEENLPPITEEERKAVQDKVSRIRENMNVKIRGECQYDSYARELAVMVRDMVEMEKEERQDTAEEKRVELHMHTNMSTMDALTPVADLINRAVKWGHPAVAVTDHGVQIGRAHV